MIRFFVNEAHRTGESVCLNEHDSRHFAKALRGQVGDEINIVAKGEVFRATVVAIAGQVTAKLTAKLEEYAEAPLKLYLLQGIAKGEHMEIIIQKAVELGVEAIIPLTLSRSVVLLKGERAAAKLLRWQKIAEAAAKQCGRGKITQILPPATLQEGLALLPPACKILLPWEEATEHSLKEALRGKPPEAAALIIGPEGGITKAEVQAAREAGAEVVTLGKRILRTETAAIVSSALVMYEWADLG